MRVCECVWAHQRTAAGCINSQEPWRAAYIHHYLLSWSTHAHTHKRKHAHCKLHPPTLLSTLSSVKPSLSCNPHGPSSSVSQQSTSLWQWPKFLLSVCVCTYVCCVCHFEDIISAYDLCRKVGVCLCIVAFFFNMSPMQCGLVYFPMNHIGVWVIRCPSWSEKDVSEKIAVMLSKG